jgi:lipopolysaccharide transport system ATP-binding protein
MSNTAIKVENLSKIYRLGEIGTGTISRDMERWFKTKVLKQEDPFLKIGETNDRANKGSSDIVYSLRDINFEIQQGDAVGIIGRNGAGKSTLLKILSRVTTPSAGKINIKGRVASLLEVGTGFHPELTGRENIYLNGAILGMRKREIDRKLDEIIDFSGVERYIDTPVKRYSSGMYVRLAFAVAAHLESEILVVDEVLAVGDADFQKKCLGKMSDITKRQGRTVLFVSHNVGAVRNLCNYGLMLQSGNLLVKGYINEVLNVYATHSEKSGSSNSAITKDSPIYIASITLANANINIDFLNPSEVGLNIRVDSRITTLISFEIILLHEQSIVAAMPLGRAYNNSHLVNPGTEIYCMKITLPNLKVGKYFVQVKLVETNIQFLDTFQDLIEFDVKSSYSSLTSWMYTDHTHPEGYFLLTGTTERVS